MYVGNFPESFSRQILAGTILVGRLGQPGPGMAAAPAVAYPQRCNNINKSNSSNNNSNSISNIARANSCITRCTSQRAQPLESLTALHKSHVAKGCPEHPALGSCDPNWVQVRSGDAARGTTSHGLLHAPRPELMLPPQQCYCQCQRRHQSYPVLKPKLKLAERQQFRMSRMSVFLSGFACFLHESRNLGERGPRVSAHMRMRRGLPANFTDGIGTPDPKPRNQ